ncbi:MAG: sigma 54-interacting transcriptional regulator [Clostridia bacterium]
MGVPIFDQYGALHQVVVSSRPILTVEALQEDFGVPAEANALNKSKENVRILENATTPDFKSNKLVGSSYSLQKVWNTIKMAAPTDATVLITGESGVGKEVVADEIYRLSARSHKTFIKVNCASIPANLLNQSCSAMKKAPLRRNTSGTGTFGRRRCPAPR